MLVGASEGSQANRSREARKINNRRAEIFEFCAKLATRDCNPQPPLRASPLQIRAAN